MTNETKERIKYYKSLLPGVKSKLMAASVMLVVALTVTATATYAWVTLSAAPEVKNINTSVAANGSLEIALADDSGLPPSASAVGDSTGAGLDVLLANKKWGNLVNLSDPAYGLSNITLRPAALNGTTGLLTNPLYGVEYGEDGRVSSNLTEDDFSYAYYDTEKKQFVADLDGKKLGVRAISTVTYENLEAASAIPELYRNSKIYLNNAKNDYIRMTNKEAEPGKSYMASLEGLVQVYVQNVLDGNPTDTLDITKYVPPLYEMLVFMMDSVMEETASSYLQIINIQQYLDGQTLYTDFSQVLADYNAGKLSNNVNTKIKSLTQFIKDYQQLHKYMLKGEKDDFSDLTVAEKNNNAAYYAYLANNGTSVYWSDLSTMIDWICQINSATINGKSMSALKAEIKNDISGALSMFNGTNSAVLHNGVLYRLEQRTGAAMSPTINISVKYIMTLKLKAVMTTSAKAPYELPTEIETVTSGYTGNLKGGTAYAEDTHALALDLWVRTNAGSDAEAVAGDPTNESFEDGSNKTTTVVTSAETAYLTLEGALKTETQTTRATVTDANGDEQPASTATFTVDGTPYEVVVFERYGEYYVIDEEGIEYLFEDTLEAEYGTLPEITYTPQVTETSVIVGYEGENRVWNEEQMAPFEGTGTSTTQGGGSCYIFYANTPADQERFLVLLESMKVVFIDGLGNQIGLARMDTKNYYAENGKVTVPMVLDKTTAINLGMDVDGKEIYGMIPLKKNVATRITALFYLDGTRLTNDMVLASGDIQGTMNIQFGSSVAIKKTTTTTTTDSEGNTSTSDSEEFIPGKDSVAAEDEDVMTQFVEVSAKLSATEYEYDPAKPATPELSVTVDGTEPNSVEARFIRAISSTQGVLQDKLTLTGSGSDWKVTCSFEKPGQYILRTVWVDGVEYHLTEPVQVTVTGSSVTSLSCEAIKEGKKATIMTADSYFTTKMSLGFNTDAAAPQSVNGIFMDETGRQVTVPFKLTDGNWNGTARFTTSGTFTMEYVEIDGETYELNSELQPTLEILLGLKVQTWLTIDAATLAELRKEFENAVATNFVLTPSLEVVKLGVSAEIYDNNGKELSNLGDVTLYYGKSGSSVKGLQSPLSWSQSAGRYTGEFFVTEAGTYKFSKVTVGSNTIENCTSAPSIKAIPPDDAYYFDDHTETYQYAPQLNAAMTLGIAYSSGADKIEATLVRNGIEYIVEGVQGYEDIEHQGDKAVNLWSFTIPNEGTSQNSAQEGEWTLKDITMYGVYYNGIYYGEDNTNEELKSVKVDLTGQNIHTKVVNYLYVTLSGTDKAGDNAFTGTFMTPHEVNDLTLTVEDYNGDAVIDSSTGAAYAINIKQMNYHMYYSKSSQYGYTSSKSGVETVSGEVTKISDIEYSVKLNLQVAGMYDTCTLGITLGESNENISMASSLIKAKYMVNGNISDRCPKYEVIWTAPTLTITGTSPAMGTTFTSKSDGVAKSVSNYHEDYYANVYTQNLDHGLANRNFDDLPSVSLKLTNAGEITSATFKYPFSNGERTDWDEVTFSEDNSEKSLEIGAREVTDTNILGNPTAYDYFLLNGTITTENIEMDFGDSTYTVKLSNPISINQGNKPKELIYVIPEKYSSGISAPAKITSADGRAITVTLPKLSGTIIEKKDNGTAVVTITERTTQPIKYAEGNKWYNFAVNNGNIITERVYSCTEGSFIEQSNTYEVSNWNVVSIGPNATKSYNADSMGTFNSMTNTATANMKLISSVEGSVVTSGAKGTMQSEATKYYNSSGSIITTYYKVENNGSATITYWKNGVQIDKPSWWDN